MTETIMCPRCGHEMTSSEEDARYVTPLRIRVCDRCYEYLHYNEAALTRFEILQNKEKKMANKKIFTPEMDEYLILSVQNHASGNAMAQKLGLPVQAVYNRISALRKNGILPKRGAAEPDPKEYTEEEPETAMADIIEEKTGEINRLNDYIAALEADMEVLRKTNDGLREGIVIAENTATELRAELDAMRESGAQAEGVAAIIEKLKRAQHDHLAEAERIGHAIYLIENAYA